MGGWTMGDGQWTVGNWRWHWPGELDCHVPFTAFRVLAMTYQETNRCISIRQDCNAPVPYSVIARKPSVSEADVAIRVLRDATQ